MSQDERRALRWLRIAGGAMLVLILLGAAVGPTAPVTANPPGFATAVVGVELAETPEEVFGVVGAPGAPERPAAVRRMQRALALDMGFLVAYATLYVALAGLLRARGRLGAGLTRAVLALAVAMAVGDALENRALWDLTGLADPAAMVAPLARLRACTLLKWYAVFAASAIVAAGIAREARAWRWSAACYGLGALLGGLGLVHLPAIEWSTLPLGVAWTATWVHALRA